MSDGRTLQEILRSRAWDDREHRKLRAKAADRIDELESMQQTTTAEIEAWKRDAKRATELEAALRDLIDRIDRHGGLGEYKGGMPFALMNARRLISQDNATGKP